MKERIWLKCKRVSKEMNLTHGSLKYYATHGRAPMMHGRAPGKISITYFPLARLIESFRKDSNGSHMASKIYQLTLELNQTPNLSLNSISNPKTLPLRVFGI